MAVHCMEIGECVHRHSLWNMPSDIFFPCFSQLQKASDKEAVDRLFKGLDTNQDNSVDFKEFATMVTCLTMMCHEHFCKK